jgi:hypothetical protein
MYYVNCEDLHYLYVWTMIHALLRANIAVMLDGDMEMPNVEMHMCEEEARCSVHGK